MRINKSLEIANFLLEKGKYMSAREIFESGFRFNQDGTTVTNIKVALNEIHESSVFVTNKNRDARGVNRYRVTQIHSISEAVKWRQLLGRK